jgi:hypothetical protein
MNIDWKTAVKTVAPSIASVFGTPLAGLGVSALLDVLLPTGEVKPADPEAYIAKAMETISPDTMLKLKEAEQAFALKIKELDIDLEKFVEDLKAKNVAGARDLKANWLKSDKWDYEPVLAALVVIAFGYAEWWVFAYAGLEHTMEPNQAILVGKMLGSVDAAFMALILFRWGSSRSSERKTEIAAQSAALDKV